jgi:predicted PurR-regulated permease PerM
MTLSRGAWMVVGAVGTAWVTVWLLSPVLAPFLIALAVAYLLDPLVDRLERAGLKRAVAAAMIIGAFFAVVVALGALLAPILQAQLIGAARAVISAALRLYEGARPLIAEMIGTRLDSAPLDATPEIAGRALSAAGAIIGGVGSGGLAIVNLLATIFLMPVAAYYLLRDWDRMLARLDSWLPRDHAATARTLLLQIDATLAGFLRGQAMVCALLGAFYAVGLTLVGLDHGLLVGLLTGVLSIVPFVGMAVGMMAGLAVAWFQFDAWTPIAFVLGVFVMGQVVEGNWLTPKLVGERVGLHPVWVMLAVMGGGAIFGLVGVMLAVPVAATLGVLVRYALARYLASRLYLGRDGVA